MKNRKKAIITIEEIQEIIDSRKFESKVDEGFDQQEQVWFTHMQVFNGNSKLILDLANEYTIFFGDWHGHYLPDSKDSMREFRETLEDLLDSKICSVGRFRDVDGVENWCGSSIGFRDYLDREYFRREYGDDKIIRCKFFDETLNQTFMT